MLDPAIVAEVFGVARACEAREDRAMGLELVKEMDAAQGSPAAPVGTLSERAEALGKGLANVSLRMDAVLNRLRPAGVGPVQSAELAQACDRLQGDRPVRDLATSLCIAERAAARLEELAGELEEKV